jgi:hypothetical protein
LEQILKVHVVCRSRVIARIIPIAMGDESFYMSSPPGRSRTMKLALIALGLLATTGVVYAACVLC